MYSIFLTNQASRLFKKLAPEVLDKLKAEAKTLDTNPLAAAPLQGNYRQYRSLQVSFNGRARACQLEG